MGPKKKYADIVTEQRGSRSCIEDRPRLPPLAPHRKQQEHRHPRLQPSLQRQQLLPGQAILPRARLRTQFLPLQPHQPICKV